MTTPTTALNPTTLDPTVYYTLPAEYVAEGMSTNDGQDVIHVEIKDGYVLYDVYNPSPDPDEDSDRRCSPDGRISPVGQRVDLAVFADTAIDGTTHEHAVITTPNAPEEQTAP